MGLSIGCGGSAVNKGDLVQFQPGVAIWNTKESPSSVIGRTDENGICVLLEERHDEVKVLFSDGLVGWVSRRVMRLNHGSR
jgi:hypothetical protein